MEFPSRLEQLRALVYFSVNTSRPLVSSYVDWFILKVEWRRRHFYDREFSHARVNLS